MEKKRVLFVCIHNSARSQIAEAFLNKLAGDKFDAQSAGLEPGILNPLAIEVMKESGIDISGNKTKSVYDYLKRGESFDYVITVCDEANGQACPMFPGKGIREHWSIADPSSFTGTWEEKLSNTRGVRESIKAKVMELITRIKTDKGIGV